MKFHLTRSRKPAKVGDMEQRTYLVQRLNAPQGFDNPFAFGGGLKNGGLADDAMEILRGIFSFDYMGAAEFEFGAVPEALNRIANSPLEAGEFSIDGTTIYLLTPEGWLEEAESRVRSWVLPYGERPHMKEAPFLDKVLDGDNEWCRALGWLEIDNGWFAFVDRDMWQNTCSLFGVQA